MALPNSALRASGSLPSRWILHHKKNQKVFVSINDVLEYISQIDHVFCPSMSVSFQDTNLKGTVAKKKVDGGTEKRERGKGCSTSKTGKEETRLYTEKVRSKELSELRETDLTSTAEWKQTQAWWPLHFCSLDIR